MEFKANEDEMIKKFNRIVCEEIDGTFTFKGVKNDKKHKDDLYSINKYVRVVNDKYLKQFLDILNLKVNIDVDLWYEQKLENDGKNVNDFPVEWKTIDDKWYMFNLFFKTQEDLQKFEEMTKIKWNGKSGWFPKKPTLTTKKIWRHSNDHKDEEVINKYPIYIISKGRWEKRLTYKCLSKMNPKPNFKIVVETDEIQKYLDNGVLEEDILEFTPERKQEITKEGDGGSIPVRNFCKYHSIDNGYERHWILDDNIDKFYRFYENSRNVVESPVLFRSLEEYTDRYTDLKLTGYNYFSFCPEISKRRVCCQKNTRVYSCSLLSNDIYDWRGTYNEDTDLSLRLLKDGLPLQYFNHFLCGKQTTKSCKGGNTDSIYQGDGLQKKLDSLIEQHPDVVKGTFKFKKVHHQVNYKPFKDLEPTLKDNVEIIKYNLIKK